MASCSRENDNNSLVTVTSYLDLYESQDILSGFSYCEQLLRQNNVLVGENQNFLTEKGELLGKKFADSIVKVLTNYEFSEDLYLSSDAETVINECDSGTDNGSDFSDCEPEPGTSNSDYEVADENRSYEVVPFSVKKKIVQVARAHPTWSLPTLKRRGCAVLKSSRQLRRWKKEVKCGETRIEISKSVNEWTFHKFKEARKNRRPVTSRNLKEWACIAALKFKTSENFKFKASDSWVSKFKGKYKIRQRKVTRYIKSKKALDVDEIDRIATNFQNTIKNLSKQFDLDFVLNSDQTGCEYRVAVNRTLSFRGEKTTEAYLGDFSKVTHSYTAQYCVTASGKLLPKVFLCVQEPLGKFGPRVQVAVNNLMEDFKNIEVTASKSGKLTKSHVLTFTETIIAPYVENKNFLLILDSWGGQKDPSLFHQRFTNEDGERNSSVEIIPPHCTPIAQPLDVFFFRQVKIFIKHLHNSTVLLEAGRHISSREDAIKVHSIIHHQLSSPAFQPMIKYAWIASGLIDEVHQHFNTVNQVCFAQEVLPSTCVDCGGKGFIRCARCGKFLCFVCFYDLYHPRNCL